MWGKTTRTTSHASRAAKTEPAAKIAASRAGWSDFQRPVPREKAHQSMKHDPAANHSAQNQAKNLTMAVWKRSGDVRFMRGAGYSRSAGEGGAGSAESGESGSSDGEAPSSPESGTTVAETTASPEATFTMRTPLAPRAVSRNDPTEVG